MSVQRWTTSVAMGDVLTPLDHSCAPVTVATLWMRLGHSVWVSHESHTLIYTGEPLWLSILFYFFSRNVMKDAVN